MARDSFRYGRTRPGLLLGLVAGLLIVSPFAYGVIKYSLRMRHESGAYASEISIVRQIESMGAEVHRDGGSVVGVHVAKDRFPDGLAETLAGLSHLRYLGAFVKVPSDPAIAKLKVATQLPQIELAGDGITDSTIDCLKDIRNLKDLRITLAGITDDGMKSLGSFRHLQYLDLSDTHVTDAGLAHLKEMQNLKILRLYGCKYVTEKGVRSLQEFLPKTRIAWDKNPIVKDGM